MGNVLRQVNAKVRRDNYRLKLPKEITSLNTMFVGLDVCHSGKRSAVGLAASYTPYATQYFTRVEYQELKQESV